MEERDYNQEIKDTADHKYIYSFDQVMHSFMIRAFLPLANRPGNLLELGSCEGAFTKRLYPHFTRVTCIEASSNAIKVAQEYFHERAVQFFNSMFEDVQLPVKYKNIVLTHTLEHIDDPIALLKRINDEWIDNNGKLFLACPNANAPSRQIAVKMGLIESNTSVTPSEKAHGHKRTYTLDTLEHDAKLAGLKVIHRSGIFFKALANFQWDKAIESGIVSQEYLEGCYQLGQVYPDLCSSIFLVCEKGE